MSEWDRMFAEAEQMRTEADQRKRKRQMGIDLARAIINLPLIAIFVVIILGCI